MCPLGSRHHAVAVRHEIRGGHRAPIEIVLFERLEPIVENLCIRPYRVVRMPTLDTMLVQKCDRRLNQLKSARSKSNGKPTGRGSRSLIPGRPLQRRARLRGLPRARERRPYE